MKAIKNKENEKKKKNLNEIFTLNIEIKYNLLRHIFDIAIM
jgi:hypothetical protein